MLNYLQVNGLRKQIKTLAKSKVTQDLHFFTLFLTLVLHEVSMRKYLMSWDSKQKRWAKMFRGERYTISAGKLSPADPTKEGTWRLANDWWTNKMLQIQSAARNLALVPQAQPFQQNGNLGNFEQVVVFLQQVLSKQLPEQNKETVSLEQARDKYYQDLQTRLNAGNIVLRRHNLIKCYIQQFVEFNNGKYPQDLRVYYNDLSIQVNNKILSPATAISKISIIKSFVTFINEQKYANITINKRLTFKQNYQVKKVYTKLEIKELLNIGNEKLNLYILLQLNCGMYSQDISDLGKSEVDLTNGYITRCRSKTDGMIVKYKLWKSTLRLLKKYQTNKQVKNKRNDYHFLLTERDTPLVTQKKNRIKRVIEVIQKKLNITTSSKHFRKTSAQILNEHETYKGYTELFLAHAPKSMAEKHYVSYSQDLFDDAIQYVGETLGIF